MKSMRFILLFISCYITIFLLTACSFEEERRILVIHSYENDYQGYAEYNKQIKKEFSKSRIPVKLFFFYLNCERYNEPQEIKRINLFIDSIAKWKPEIILVNDDQATYSLLKSHNPILKEIPIVFSGVNYPNWELIKQYDNVTGFEDKIDFSKNLKMIKRLTGITNIYTILDYTFLDRKIRNHINCQLESTDIISNLDWHLDKQATWKETHHKGNIVFTALSARKISEEQTEDPTNGADFLWAIGKYSKMPYLQTKLDYTTLTMASFSTQMRFTAINELFDCGYNFLGEYMTPRHIQVQESVHAAVQILRGKNITDMSIQESSKGYFIDWNVMQKEGMTIADIPNEYTIINIPFKALHPVLWWSGLLGSIFFILGLLSGITYLYWRETQKKRSILYELEDEKESIHRNNELLLKLVNDILEISRIESGYMSFKYDDYPLATLINDTYQTHKVLISQNINFILEESGEDIIVHLDKDRLIQVITNLLNNAVKFTQEGYIKLGWKYLSQNEEVEIYVEDSGIGIPQSEQKMIFNRFYKQNEFAQGTGLGLSICKVIVEKLQGRLSLQSTAGVGSRFSIFFSCKKQSL
ncbi:sensor histidine kinase [Bacteroides hominis]|uniref:sensor histidine kinase n=1 Tax=Bacteroides hominis TaxID=2763023 RepID=UPI00294A6684|nr:sensor histidine kinase [Bacteroides hominis (ex Liu et al. 2022)]MDV6185722.1 sensor histidine kinase [Bacteroides hominis (ex Liu et al. 2022)]